MRRFVGISQQLLTTNIEAVKKVAELLLKQETISQHDIVQLIGPRPYKSDVSRDCVFGYGFGLRMDPIFLHRIQASMDEYINASSWAHSGEAKKVGE